MSCTSKQAGQLFTVRFVGLRDANGNKIDTACHLHVFLNGAQSSVLVRDDSSPTSPIKYSQGEADEDNEYVAEVRIDSPALAGFKFHFPAIEHVAPIASTPIRGPALVEPTV
jgi:hypothetical protein